MQVASCELLVESCDLRGASSSELQSVFSVNSTGQVVKSISKIC